MNDDNARLDRIEASLERLVKATADGFEGIMASLGVMSARISVVEAQMVEVIGRLRIIGEQLANHRHGEDGKAA